jgi:hypothetical protein
VKALVAVAIFSVVVSGGLLFWMGWKNEEAKAACRERGGVPVLFREGIMCFAPGVVK